MKLAQQSQGEPKQGIDRRSQFSERLYRHNERIYLYQYLDVIDTQTNQLLGYLSDISIEGLTFISQYPVVEKTVKTICIHNTVINQPCLIQATIETLWIKPNINPLWCCIGCRFSSIDAYNRKLLKQVGLALCFPKGMVICREKQD